jgi:hypothetical protein
VRVAALFVTPKSIYKTMPGVDAFDLERDAPPALAYWLVAVSRACA